MNKQNDNRDNNDIVYAQGYDYDRYMNSIAVEEAAIAIYNAIQYGDTWPYPNITFMSGPMPDSADYNLIPGVHKILCTGMIEDDNIEYITALGKILGIWIKYDGDFAICGDTGTVEWMSINNKNNIPAILMPVTKRTDINDGIHYSFVVNDNEWHMGDMVRGVEFRIYPSGQYNTYSLDRIIISKDVATRLITEGFYNTITKSGSPNIRLRSVDGKTIVKADITGISPPYDNGDHIIAKIEIDRSSLVYCGQYTGDDVIATCYIYDGDTRILGAYIGGVWENQTCTESICAITFWLATASKYTIDIDVGLRQYLTLQMENP